MHANVGVDFSVLPKIKCVFNLCDLKLNLRQALLRLTKRLALLLFFSPQAVQRVIDTWRERARDPVVDLSHQPSISLVHDLILSRQSPLAKLRRREITARYLESRPMVTQRYNPPKIPIVCEWRSVVCVDLFGFFKLEDWEF